MDYQEPVLPVPSGWRRCLPEWQKRRPNIEDGNLLLSTLHTLDRRSAVALVRAARDFAKAVWIAESDSELTWLLLVSAIEVAAEHWDSTSSDPQEEFERSFPKIASRFDADDLRFISHEMRHLTRSQRKFLKFCGNFLPGPPLDVPEEHRTLDWSHLDDMIVRLRTIYSHRSARLHGSVTFPNPMLRPEPFELPLEKPLGEGFASGFNQWSPDDVPLSLHSFTHLTRGVLLNWWRNMVPLDVG